MAAAAASASKNKKKKAVSRLWMRMDRLGQSELMEYDKSVIINRCSIPARDLSILGPIFSESSTIVGREKAMIVNLEFVRAIVTAEEVFVLDPLKQEVLAFVDQLRRQLSNVSGDQDDEVAVPFEFEVVEVALEVVYSYLESSVGEVEKEAYPALDLLAKSVSNEKLEYVRTLKNNLIRLLGRVQKVRDKIEEVLEDDEDMAKLYLSRKKMGAAMNIEELEMLLEAYFKRLDSTRNKILSVREYIDETEEYVSIQLKNGRNESLEMKLTLVMASLGIAVGTVIAGIFGMNIQLPLFHSKSGQFYFNLVAGLIVALSLAIFLLLYRYAFASASARRQSKN